MSKNTVYLRGFKAKLALLIISRQMKVFKTFNVSETHVSLGKTKKIPVTLASFSGNHVQKLA